MTASPMPSVRSPLRRALRYVLIGSALCFTPFVVLALVLASYLGLNGEAAALRKEIFRVTPAGWSTQVQVSLGESTLRAVELAMHFVQDEKIAQVGGILAAVKRASVGVYQHQVAAGENWSRPELLTKTDQAMEKRGWTRLVGVVDEESTVLVYSPRDGMNGESVELCVAVINHKDMVIASAKVKEDVIGELVEKQGWGPLRHKMPFLTLD